LQVSLSEAHIAQNVRLESLTYRKRSSIALCRKKGQPAMKNVRLIIAIWLASVAHAARADPFAFGGPTMGTTYHVRLVAAESAVDLPQLKKHIESLLAEIDRQMSTYRDDSELSRFNRAPAGKWFVVSRSTARVVAAAQEISRKTDGALDVTVAPLVRLWHFGPTEPGSAGAAFTPPPDAAVQSALALVGYEKLEVRRDPPALRKHAAGLEVDLSSIAPGYAARFGPRGGDMTGSRGAWQSSGRWFSGARCKWPCRWRMRRSRPPAITARFSSMRAGDIRISLIRQREGPLTTLWRQSRWWPRRAWKRTVGTRRFW
jgi:hypothetical protein